MRRFKIDDINAYGAQNAARLQEALAQPVNPRLTGLFSTHITDNFGILGSIAYTRQRQQIDRYARSIHGVIPVLPEALSMPVDPHDAARVVGRTRPVWLRVLAPDGLRQPGGPQPAPYCVPRQPISVAG